MIDLKKIDFYRLQYKKTKYYDYGGSFIYWEHLEYDGKVKYVTVTDADNTSKEYFHVKRKLLKLPFLNVYVGSKWVPIDEVRIIYYDSKTEQLAMSLNEAMQLIDYQQNNNPVYDPKSPPDAE